MRRFAVSLLILWPALVASAAEPDAWCGTTPAGGRQVAALHRYRLSGGPRASASSALPDRDVQDVAVLQDRGDLVARRNPFDLDGAALRFAPTRDGYSLSRLAIPVEPPGTPLALGDDDAQALELPFPFPFYGKIYRKATLGADGSLSFGTASGTETDRSLAAFLGGPPRIAPFFADLDPSRGGQVSAVLRPDRAAFVWSGVPGGGQINANTFEVALHPDGAIDVVFGTMQSREAIVGLSPGATLELTAADLSAPLPARATGAVLERFSETEHVDLVSVGRRFYASHPDLFEQLVVYTTRPLNPLAGSLAFEINVKNEVQGIGAALRDEASDWGSSGALASVVFMDAIDRYLDVDGFEFLGHEVGHRWLAQLRFRDRSGAASSALLGRGEVHWSFFLASAASVLEGNDIADLGSGRFETVDFARRYSPLDQYAMGLREASEVPPFFFVEAPDNFHPSRPFKASSAPEAGVTFAGTPRQVTIEDVVAAMGPRVPAAAAAPHRLRQAFLLVADDEAPATQPRLVAVARIRSRFEAYYREATDGRGSADSTLP